MNTSTKRRRTRPDPGDLRARIRATGLKSTAPRIAVLEHLEMAQAPLSHAEITESLLPRGFDRATLYRNLIDLTEAGLLSRADLGDHVWRFEVRREQKTHAVEHPHFVCTDCGEVSCLPGVEVQIHPGPKSPRFLYKPEMEVQLKGVCERCE
jgi:Fur family ferric uptake transcriptional regulator